MKYLLSVVKKNRLLVFYYLILGVILAFLNNFSTNYFQVLIDRFQNNSMNLKIIIVYGLVLIVLCILNYINKYPDCKLNHSILLDFKLKSLKKISTIDYQMYLKISKDKLIQKLENGSEAGKNILFNFIFKLIRELLPSIIFSLLFIYKINKVIMFSIIGGYLIVFIITKLLLKLLYKLKNEVLTNEENLNHFLVRGLLELIVFRINKKFKYEINKAVFSKNKIISSKVKLKLIHEAFFTIFAFLIIIIKILIIYIGWKTKILSIGEIIALIALVDNAYNPIAIFNVIFVQYKLDKISFKRYTNFLDIKDDNQLLENKKITDLIGNIDILNLSFYYENKLIINNINISIKERESIALVGESGSGKSTLLKLIIGLLKPHYGKILIDGENLSEVNLNSYYDFVSYISQESPVFDGTLRENIVFDQIIDDVLIIKILSKVKLFGFYKNLDKGLETQIGEKGVLLSGGEKQRLALARLYFSKSSIVILDEATSAMDNIIEQSVIDNLTHYLKNRTVIVVAHRLGTIKKFDKIIVFKEGKILGQGKFEELINNNNYFNKLYYLEKTKNLSKT